MCFGCSRETYHYIYMVPPNLYIHTYIITIHYTNHFSLITTDYYHHRSSVIGHRIVED